jgi:hypothetical protein
MSLDALNAFRQANGLAPLQILPLDFNPNLASALLITGPPIKKKPRGRPIKRIADHCPIRRNFIRRKGHTSVT